MTYIHFGSNYYHLVISDSLFNTIMCWCCVVYDVNIWLIFTIPVFMIDIHWPSADLAYSGNWICTMWVYLNPFKIYPSASNLHWWHIYKIAVFICDRNKSVVANFSLRSLFVCLYTALMSAFVLLSFVLYIFLSTDFMMQVWRILDKMI